MVRPNRGLLYGRIPNLQETASSTGKVVYFRCYEKRDDIREILAYCGSRCAYTVESPLHFQYFVEWSEEHPEDGILRLYPRLTSGNQFGMDEDTVLEILKKAKELPGIEAEESIISQEHRRRI